MLETNDAVQRVNDQRGARLSALMDGELPTRQELDALLLDVDARATWGRYHLIRDAVQNELPDVVCDLSARISLALDDEPTVLAPRPRPISPWQKAVGVAMAASVFAVALISFQTFQSVDAPTAGQAQQGADAVEKVSEPTMVAPYQQVADAPVVVDDERARLEELLINHTEAVSANGLNVMLPYARVVSERIDLPLDEPPATVDGPVATPAVAPEQP